MGEYVEYRLERILPLFEELQNVQLLQPQEVNQLIKQCRRYEYRLVKQRKRESDYLHYIDYLKDLLKLIRKRRVSNAYMLRYSSIEKPLKAKISTVYSICVEKFKGNKKIWRSYLDFLKHNKMNMLCSKKFTEALQFHGRDVDLRVESAVWEFFGNSSIENARTQLQMCLRAEPKEIKFWSALFKVEIFFVKRMKSRLDFLKRKERGETTEQENEDFQKEAEQSESVPDAVMQMKLADIIVSQATKEFENPVQLAELYLSFWRCTRECGVDAQRLQDELYEKLNQMSQPGAIEYAQLANVEKRSEDDKVDIWDAFDEVLSTLPTEKMYRLFLEFCAVHSGLNARMAEKRAIRELVKRGFAKLEDYLKVLDDYDMKNPEDLQEFKKAGSEAIKIYPNSSQFWEAVISAHIHHFNTCEGEDIKENKKSIMALFNDAFVKCPVEEQLPIWKLAIDFTIQHQPKNVEKLFDQCFLSASPHVSSGVKCIRLDYLESIGDVDLFRNQARKLIDNKPNETSFYKHLAKLESARSDCDRSLVKLAWECAVAENGQNCYESWIGFLQYLLKNEPLAVGKVYQRAQLNLSGESAGLFAIEWTKLSQHAGEQGFNANK